MSDNDKFALAVEKFLARHGWSPTRFGRELAGDPQFVFDLRDGREPRTETREKVRAAMQNVQTTTDVSEKSVLRLGVAGLGTVGAALVTTLEERKEALLTRHGRSIEVSAIGARSRSRDRGFDLAPYEWFDDPVALASSSNVDLFVELIGGEDGPALAAVRAALQSGKPVVTANKALLAKHGVELAKLAEENGANIGFEAAVAGGIPVIKTLREGLGAAQIQRVFGIMNGTCNYILTRMSQEDIAFEECLRDAQRLGYAEADPTFDIGGFDTAHKLAILTSLCFGCEINADEMFIEGIEAITQADMQVAQDLGFKIKLLGIASKSKEGIEQRVHPTLVPEASAIGRVDDVLNAVGLETDHISDLMLVGPGAGGSATAASVLSDILDIARGQQIAPLGVPTSHLQPYQKAPIKAHAGGYYLRLNITDIPGALASVTTRLSEAGISIESVLQRPDIQVEENLADAENSRTVVIITHETLEAHIRNALQHMTDDGFTAGTPQLIRIENF